MTVHLLDTHVLIWSQEDPAKLGKKAQKLLVSAADTIVLSAISALELARLAHMGQIKLKMPIARWFDQAVDALVATVLPVDAATSFEAYALPGTFHKDPADRLLVATARLRNATLISVDERLLAYNHVRTVDASR